MTYVLIVGLAGLFYYIGNSDYYNKGGWLALMSVAASFLGSWAGLLGVFGANLLLWILLLIYNLFGKRPPGSESD